MKLEIHHYHHFDNESAILATLGRIETHLKIIQQGNVTIMSAISDFAAKQTAHNDAVRADLDTIKQKLADQTALITTLQTSAGTITPEDQTTLDALEANNAELQGAADALAGKTPPTPPADAAPTP